MLLTIADRRELGSFFATLDPSKLREESLREGTSGEESVLLRLQPGDSALLFREPPTRGDLPFRVVIPDGEVEDFFAWTSTYIDSLFPLTGFVEVTEVSQAVAERARPHASARARSALIGPVLLDAVLQTKARNRVPDTILPAALRTLSAVFYQTTIAGSVNSEIADIASLWMAARESLGSSEMPFAVSHVLAFWGRAVSAITEQHSEDELGGIVKRYFQSGADESPWRDSTWDRAFSIEPRDIVAASREERLRYIDRRIDSLDQNIDPEVRSAFGGYLLSLLADGDFNLWPTTYAYSSYPTLPLWFGLFVGGSVRGNILSANQSIGRRLLNLLQYRADDVDIDAREFLVSRRVRARASSPVDFPLATYSVLKARLSHEVCGWFSVREVPPQQPASSAKREQESRSGSELRAILDARMLAERITRTLAPFTHSPASNQHHSTGDGTKIYSALDAAPDATKGEDVKPRQQAKDSLLPLSPALGERRKRPTGKKQRKRS